MVRTRIGWPPRIHPSPKESAGRKLLPPFGWCSGVACHIKISVPARGHCAPDAAVPSTDSHPYLAPTVLVPSPSTKKLLFEYAQRSFIFNTQFLVSNFQSYLLFFFSITKASFSISTFIESPSSTSPRMIIRASLSSSSVWITRLSGRAPRF